MAINLNRTEAVLKRLEENQQPKEHSSPENDSSIMAEYNQCMEVIRRDYLVKEQNSNVSATQVILT